MLGNFETMAVDQVSRRRCKLCLQLIRREPEPLAEQLFQPMPPCHLGEGDFDGLGLGFGPGYRHHTVENILIDMHRHFHNKSTSMVSEPYFNLKVWLTYQPVDI